LEALLSPLSSRGADWRARVGSAMTRLLHRQRTLGAPFKPCFGLEWDTQHSTPPDFGLSVGVNSGFPTTLRQSRATYAAFSKESSMRSIDTTKHDRNPEEAEGSAVPLSALANVPWANRLRDRDQFVCRVLTQTLIQVGCIHPCLTPGFPATSRRLN
jgi:hypothetical protein